MYVQYVSSSFYVVTAPVVSTSVYTYVRNYRGRDNVETLSSFYVVTAQRYGNRSESFTCVTVLSPVMDINHYDE
jgi:hypothetical protein